MKRLLSDGSMGALLSQMGYGTPCPDELVITHPEVILKIHQSYIEAGADIIIADTFGATESVLRHKKHSGQTREFTRAAIRLAKQAAQGRAKVACDIGPTGEFLYPVGERSFDSLYAEFIEQISAAKEAGADLVFIETQTDLAEGRMACLAAKELGMPVIASFSICANGRTLTGATPEAVAVTLEAAGADAIGINCSLGPIELIESVKKMRRVTKLPIAVQPNAGLPVTAPDGSVSYPFTPEEFEKGMRRIIEAGASIIGGCCGTTPEHIARIKPLTDGEMPESGCDGTEYLASSREVYAKAAALSRIEKIDDPEDAFDVDEDTTIIEVNADEFTPEMILETAANTKLPLLISGSDKAKIAAAVRVYPGKALVECS